MLNSREMRAVNVYCQRYRVKNKSHFLRETIMNAIIKKFDNDLPSLWEETGPDLFSPDKEPVDLER